MVPLCRNCNLPLKRLQSGIYQCSICQMSYKPGQSTPLLKKYTPKNINPETTEDKEIEVFVQRVTQKLVPIYKDYPTSTKRILYGNRLKLRNKLMQVVEGKIGFQTWFNEVCRDFGKRPVDFARLLLEATEGLESEDAKELRKGCQEYYDNMSIAYDPNIAQKMAMAKMRSRYG